MDVRAGCGLDRGLRHSGRGHRVWRRRCERAERTPTAEWSHVTGKVVDNCGDPAAGITVWASGKATVISDAAGGFTFTDVTVPYDLFAVTPGAQVTLVGYNGLTRLDPIVPAATSTAPQRQASLTVSLSGGTNPDPGVQTVVQLDPEWGTSLTTAVTDGFRTDYQWCGPPTVVGTAHVLQYHMLDHTRFYYWNYGKVDNIALAEGSDAQQAVAMTAIAQTALTGEMVLPEGYTPQYHIMNISFGSASGAIRLAFHQPTSTDFSYDTPVIPGATIDLYVSATDPSGRATAMTRRRLPVDATELEFTLEPGLDLSAPAEAASGVDLDAQSFAWSATSGGLQQIIAQSPNFVFTVFTAGASVRLPAFAELGLGAVPSGTSFEWRVTRSAGYTPDDIAAPARFSTPDGIQLGTHAEDSQQGSPFQHFTTK